MLNKSTKVHRHQLYLTFLVLSLILIILPFPQEKALACSCVEGGAKEKVKRSAAVFLGRVVDIGGSIKGEVGRLRKYTFEVEATWKGELNKRTTVYSYDGEGASCGYHFKQNGSYLVYSYPGKEGLLQTNLCSGNIAEVKAGEELLVLGPGTKVIEKIFTAPSHSAASKFIYIYFALGLFILAGSILVLITRRKKQ